MKQDKAVQYIIKHPTCTAQEIMDAVQCKKSVAYSALSAWNAVREIKTQSVVGVIADTHIPAVHPGYLEFITKTFEWMNVTDVVHIGDLVDNHALSRHISEPDASSVNDELDLAIKGIKMWTSLFPDVKMCCGNHDAISTRQAKTLGISVRFMKDFNDIYELPKTWNVQFDHVIQGVLYDHGIGSNGMYGAKNTALKERRSYVQGHTHAHGGVHYLSSLTDTIFGMNVGCGVDEKHLQMRYGKKFRAKSTLGCGIVINGKMGFFIPMEKV